ncbi:MAG: ATP-grasp domain-containing protein [Lachnospiraceae bacterium]|nr:ATP-grasp domain-containing protein [Lachnospiraceae bacterium]
MVDFIVFPSSYFDVKKVDEDLQKEYEAALATGLFDVIMFGYDNWFQQGKLVLSGRQPELRNAVYRGWMMPPDKYEKFYQALLENNIQLVTEPQEYEQMHIFPNIYKAFGNDTAKMKIFPLHAQMDVEELKESFKRFMIKDFVKSVKGTEFPKFFDQSVTQEEFDRWMEVFYKYRGNLLTGGICVKEFLDLKFYDGKTNEYRVFYINHEVATVSRNSTQPIFAPEVPRELVEKYKNLGSVYYTVDFAELEDGSWKVIEAGDGSVSGLSENQDMEGYFRTLYHCFANRN